MSCAVAMPAIRQPAAAAADNRVMDAEDSVRLDRLALALGPGQRRPAMVAIASPGEALSTAWEENACAGYWSRWPTLAQLRRGVRRLAQETCQRGATVVLYGDPNYPARLSSLARPPAVLFVWGTLPEAPMVAIVGARAALVTAVNEAATLAERCAQEGWVVVSGGALGIDAAAHRGALAGGGQTVAVLGSGLNWLYPRDHKDLFAAVAQRGALLTTYPLGTGPKRHHFPARNALIAALADRVVVVEAGIRSGALITARHAQHLAIPVLAYATSPGARQLVSEGARPVRCADDVAALLAGRAANAPTAALLDARQAAALSLLAEAALSVDELAQQMAIRPGAAAALLLRLEGAGYLVALPDGRYGKVPALEHGVAGG